MPLARVISFIRRNRATPCQAMLPKTSTFGGLVLFALLVATLVPTTTEAVTENCICGDAVIPVCGTDGNTYMNACELECRKKQTGVRLAKFGNCKGDPDRPYGDNP